MAKVLQLINRPEQNLALLKIDGQAIPVSLLDGPAGSPVIPAVLQGNIFIDPQNSTGNASDANPGTAAAPFLTYAGVVKAWGTTRPLLNTATTLVAMSLITEPVVFEPYVLGNVAVGMRGNAVTAVGAAAILAGTVTKSRALGSNRALSATYTALTAAGLMLINATHPSVAWAQRTLGANAWQTTQPLVAADGLGVASTPAEVDTWANGDSVQPSSLISVNLVRFAPTFLDNMAGGTGAFLYRLNLSNPAGTAVVPGRCMLDGTGGAIRLQECSSSTNVSVFMIAYDDGNTTAPSLFLNCMMQGVVKLAGPGQILLIGGTMIGFGDIAYARLVIDGDFILGTSMGAFGLVNLGFVYFDVAGSILQISLQATVGASLGYGGAALYGNAGGNGEAQVFTDARLVKSASTWTALITNVNMAAGIMLNGLRTGVSHTGAAPDVFNGGIATTPANLDAAAGAAGFGGNANSLQLGGASTSNQQ